MRLMTFQLHCITKGVSLTLEYKEWYHQHHLLMYICVIIYLALFIEADSRGVKVLASKPSGTPV